LRLFGGV